MYDAKINQGKIYSSDLKNCHSVKEAESSEAGYNLRGKKTLESYGNLVFVTKNNQATQWSLINDCIGVIIKNIQKEDAGFNFCTAHI